jgi:hypothetical protein
VAAALRPLARAKGDDSACPSPPILVGRQSRMAAGSRLCRKDGVETMDDVLSQYQACGAETRDEYLRDLANDNGLPLECVLRLANRLGEREDFGRLPLLCELGIASAQAAPPA